MTRRKNQILKSTKRVFEGKSYDIWQWEQRMYDGSLKTFEKVKKKNTEVQIIALVDGQILIQDQEQPHRPPFVSLPGGQCDPGETELEAAKRELLEETGYSSDDVFLWKAFDSPYSSIIRTAYYFIARDCHKIAKLDLDNGEKIQNRLISFEEFLLLAEEESFRNREIVIPLFRMRLNEDEKRDFKKILRNKKPDKLF